MLAHVVERERDRWINEWGGGEAKGSETKDEVVKLVIDIGIEGKGNVWNNKVEIRGEINKERQIDG